MYLFTILLLIFSFSSLTAYSLFSYLDKQKRLRERSLQVSGSKSMEQYHQNDEEIRLTPAHFVTNILVKLSKKIKLKPSQNLELELARAGLELSASEFLLLNLILVILPFLLLFFGYAVPICVLLAFIGGLLPWFYLKNKQAKRLQLFGDQIPEVLVTIANSLKAGYSFLQAMELVSKESDPPIAEEFTRVLKAINLGATTEEGLRNMVERVNSEDLDLVITAVLIQRQVGGNLAEILESIAYTIRERIRIKGEIRTLTAQGRISGLVIAALPFIMSVLMYLVNPEYVSPLFMTPMGRLLLGVGLLGQLLAIILIRKIVDIQV